MEELKLMVPTYNGSWLKGSDIELADFDEPSVPVFIHQADGVRIVLGTHDQGDHTKPEVQIERRHNGWMIFLQSRGGCDESGFVVFLDDGRSFVAKQKGYGPTESIEMVEYEEAIAELDDISPAGLPCAPTMMVEQVPVDKNADCQHGELTIGRPVSSLGMAQLPISGTVIDALKSAQEALAGDSNDDEHDALLALVEELQRCNLGEHQSYSEDWLIEDFAGWAGLDPGGVPNQQDVQTYVKEARPADSNPAEVMLVLRKWAETIPTTSADPFVYVANPVKSDAN